MASSNHAPETGPAAETTRQEEGLAATSSITTGDAAALQESDKENLVASSSAESQNPLTTKDTTTEKSGGVTATTTREDDDASKQPQTTESSEPKTTTTTPAIGPSSPQPTAPAEEPEDSGPSLVITLLLTTGARHPFKIDGKYLRKRAVNVENYDPFVMSVYTLKELIWREWRSEWEPRPSSPSLIRLISFGKLLDDKAPLSDSKFSRDAPNVVHMTVKPQEIVDEEDAKGAKANYTRERDGDERSPRCRCIIL
ncbi:hypothetical protein VTN00DRAFT_9957 [Thermoascus crustaceus]|uniref:uncharacterized protein n=1 Tax=Thermoascus crustaceus TaxID=5088 RepID=UPI003743F515